jgi:hypothetical protein
MDNQKATLLREWITCHSEGRIVPAFTVNGELRLTPEATEFLGRLPVGPMYVYLLGVERGEEFRPLYIGKSNDPKGRWTQGHLRGLRRAQRGEGGSYVRWLQTVTQAHPRPLLICIAENEIQFPPIPGFPVSGGSVEYQLISLVTDAYPGTLLNHEGVPR